MANYTICINCGKSTGKYERKRCSDCNKKFKNSGYLRGNKNGRWSGGKTKNTAGYVELNKSLVPEEYHYLSDCRGYIKEHRIVAAKKYKRVLLKKEIVHHLNGVKTDNRPENLAITDLSKHERHTFERQLQVRIRELEDLAKKNL